MNFILQSIGMFINDAFWVFFWFLFFQKFIDVNGWTFITMMMLYSIGETSYGLCSIFFGNRSRLANLIENGSLDYYLTLPKEIISHFLAKFKYSGIGDLVFGLLLAFFVISLKQLPLFILLVISSSLILISWSILAGSLALYFNKSSAASKSMNDSILLLLGYPFSVYEGFSKFLILFIIPAGFVAGVPVELLINFDIKWLIYLLLFTISIFLISIYIFYKGLIRYSSGNSMNMRG
ncbi:MAG: ABC-2 family transporter protein [Candidatus Pacearchaeota archaeon]